jgi:hypothetical protein
MSELSRCLLWTESAQRLQSPRLNPATPRHRDLKHPSRVHVRPGLAVGKAGAQLQNAPIQSVQAVQQFPHRQRLGENLVQLITGMQAVQRGAVDQLERPWAWWMSRFAVQFSLRPRALAISRRVGGRPRLWLSSASSPRRAQLLGPAGRQVDRPKKFGGRRAHKGAYPKQRIGREPITSRMIKPLHRGDQAEAAFLE